MTESHLNALTVSRRVLRTLIAMNLGWGFLILALLITTLIAPRWAMGALGTPRTDSDGPLILGMQLMAVVGILAVPVTHFALTQLMAIVMTLSVGDPFVAENARRLQGIAWAVLGLELCRIVVGIIAASASFKSAGLNVGWKFSPTPWLAVLLLFVLAQVFNEGTRMREELDGTV